VPRVRAYKIKMIHALKPSDQVARRSFAVDMLQRIDAPPHFLWEVCFSDEATVRLNGVINRYNAGFGAFKIHMSRVGERQPKNEPVSLFNAWQVDWTVFLFGKDCDQIFVLRHAGAVCVCPIFTSNYPPTGWGTATSITMMGITWTERWLGDGPIAWSPNSQI
jgi:hypothetical protein